MKDASYYKKLNYRWIGYYDEKDKAYFVEFPELSGCIANGETPSKALQNAISVKNEWIQTALDEGWTIPEPGVAADASGRVTARVPKTVHRKLADRAKEEGVSINQLILTYLSEGLERSSARHYFEKLLIKKGSKSIQHAGAR